LLTVHWIDPGNGSNLPFTASSFSVVLSFFSNPFLVRRTVSFICTFVGGLCHPLFLSSSSFKPPPFSFQVGSIGDPEDGGSGVLPLDWSDWVAEFLRRLLSTLHNLEPSSESPSSSGTFFMAGGSMFRPMLELLFGRLTLPLYKQVGDTA
jgi:hypothetical protein